MIIFKTKNLRWYQIKPDMTKIYSVGQKRCEFVSVYITVDYLAVISGTIKYQINRNK